MAEILPSVKNSREGTHREFRKRINEEKDKIGNSVVFSKLKETKTGRRRKRLTVGWFCDLF